MGPLSLCPRDLGKASELTTSDCSGRPGPADGSNKPPKFFHTACPRVTLWKLCGAQIKAERALGSSRNHGNALPQLCHRTATSPKWHSTPDIFIYPWVKPRFFLGDGSIGRAGTRGTNWWPARSAASTTSNNSNRAPALAYCLSTFSTFERSRPC